MALRDEGRLSLDDTLDTFVPEVTQPGLTIRQCLAHVSGMQREPVGDVWETLVNPDAAELVAGFNQAERVHRAAPPVALLQPGLLDARRGRRPPRRPAVGRVAAGPDPRPAGDAAHDGRASTAGTRRATTCRRAPTCPCRRSQLDLRALNPCGGLASTGADLARWSAFVADPVAEVLAPDTLEEMCEPQVVMDRERWTAAMGLGFFLVRSGTRTYVGHTGGMPGHITALFTDREREDRRHGAHQLRHHARHRRLRDRAGRPRHRARPGRAGALAARDRRSPTELADLVGVWYTEGSPFTFSVREGRLEARAEGLPEHKPSLALRAGRAGPVYRTVAGREHGELLRVTRDADGRVTQDELGDVPRHPRAARVRRVALRAS